ncbi:MAG: 50S ribosomal protein L4, partial [Phycisphaeraceae bacterium]
LLAIGHEDRGTFLAARNLANVNTIQMDQINAYDLLSTRFLLVDKATLSGWLDAQKSAVKTIEEAA